LRASGKAVYRLIEIEMEDTSELVESENGVGSGFVEQLRDPSAPTPETNGAILLHETAL
jgi:hypothetical protein